MIVSIASVTHWWVEFSRLETQFNVCMRCTVWGKSVNEWLAAGEESAWTVAATAPGRRPPVPSRRGPQPVAAWSVSATASSRGESTEPTSTEGVHQSASRWGDTQSQRIVKFRDWEGSSLTILVDDPTAVCPSVCSWRMFSQTAKRIWQKFCTRTDRGLSLTPCLGVAQGFHQGSRKCATGKILCDEYNTTKISWNIDCLISSQSRSPASSKLLWGEHIQF